MFWPSLEKPEGSECLSAVMTIYDKLAPNSQGHQSLLISSLGAGTEEISSLSPKEQ
jgi:hypothetical protein